MLTKTNNPDTSAANEARISDLLEQMTLKEKVGQLIQFSGFYDVTGPAPEGEREAQKHRLLQSGIIGSMLNVVGCDEVRTFQTWAVENSRLGIPMLFAYDVIHGQKTMFPIPLAEAASWDLDLIQQSARIAAIEASAQGLNWTYAPMVDVTRDARWGRVMEGAGEDPFLNAVIAEARVNGFQGDDLKARDTVASTIKHFAGYGFVEAGKEYNAAEIGTVTLFNTVLQPFRDVLQATNPRSVMNAFNTLNGIPATGDKVLQRDLLKEDWGFDGVVVSDWASAIEMIDHGFAEDSRDAARLAIQAGCDVDMESYVYLDHLEDLVVSGEVDMALVDDAVRRTLRLKLELGLFDDPYRYLDRDRERELLLSEAHLEASLSMARKSIVLLKNDGDTLPLRKQEKVALVGALAADKDAPLGNWRAQADAHSAMSVLEGFERAGLEFSYSEGVSVQVGEAGFEYPVMVNTGNRDGIEDAVAVARDVDKVVLVLGETARQTGEGRSRTELGLPGLQQELLEAIYAVNQNLVLVVVSGRPLVLSWADQHVPAIVQAWHLGHRSGQAITEVLTGQENPSGKLPMSFPRAVGQLPLYYNHLNTGRPNRREQVVWAHYSDVDNSPLYPFGHGLSYSTFSYSGLTVSIQSDHIAVNVTVTNESEIDGEEVIQLYIRDRVASIARPVRELKAFEKEMLKAKSSLVIELKLSARDFGFYGPDGAFRLEPGEFDIFVGGSSQTSLTQTIRLSSDQLRSLGQRSEIMK
ncbi:MAG: beta-glucosidase BglX [Henriciella sp.]|nr:beta-glucosidase BglX [Henriciella sp.]